MAVGAKIAKTADRGKPTRIVKRVKDRERGVPGGIYISCSGVNFSRSCKSACNSGLDEAEGAPRCAPSAFPCVAYAARSTR